MAKLTIGQKAARVLQLLLGLRNRRVAAALKQYGFTDQELGRGWSLMQALTSNKLGVTIAANDPHLVRELDAWENRWFPIVDAVLASNAPEAYAMVFKNLSQTEGPEVIVSVGTFVERIELLGKPKDDGGLGAPGKKVRELLEKRGLTSAVVGEAKSLLDRVGKIAPATESDPVATTEADALLERDLWNWYLEWSGIARVAITDRRLLKALGFLRTTAGGEAEEPTDPGLTPIPTDPAQA